MASFSIESNISGVRTLPFDKPIKTSAPFTASSKVLTSLSVANSAFCSVRFGESFRITPLLSHIMIFLGFAPKAT